MAAGTEVKPNEPDLFEENADDGDNAPPESAPPPGTRRRATAARPVTRAIIRPETAAARPRRSGGAAIRASGSTAAPAKIFGRDLNNDAYLLAFAGAFLVGIIFNVMPCVLPVLPLKAIGFYEVAQHNRAQERSPSAPSSAPGSSRASRVLAVLIVVLKVINWGELFTQVVVRRADGRSCCVAMALSMFGLFTINVPTALYNVTPRHDTYVGNFLFGILTAVLSTPCTFGMFVGLLAWASTQPAAVGVALIMTVGVGMAFPYLVLSAFPELARRFPRGGAVGARSCKQIHGLPAAGDGRLLRQPAAPRAGRPGGCLVGDLRDHRRGGRCSWRSAALQVSKSNVGRVAAVAVAVAILVPSTYAVATADCQAVRVDAVHPRGPGGGEGVGQGRAGRVHGDVVRQLPLPRGDGPQEPARSSPPSASTTS